MLLERQALVDRAVAAERERCARIAETWYERLKEVGCEKFQSIRRKAGDAIAECIRHGDVT